MKLKKRRFKSLVALLLVISMIVSPVSNISAAEKTKEVQSSIKSETNKSFVGDGFEVNFNVDSQWNGAFNGNITIKNTGDTPIENWYLMFDMKNEISNIWNASIESFENGIYIIKNAGWNQDIPVNGTVSFGFSGIGEEIFYPTKYNIPILKNNVDITNYTVDFSINNDWGAGFAAAINISNKSDNTIEDWTIEFDFDKTITNIWNGVIKEHTGNHYIIKNASYNQNIAAGQTISIGFNGEDGNVINTPSNYILSEICLNNTKYIQLADGKIDADYLYKAIYPNLLSRGMSTDNILLADDYDNDNLTLAEEYKLDTNPFLADTDEDGINDYDEITIYKTNPIKWDTDDDSMSDGTEISSGLNPLIADTDGDGILDSDESVTQNIRFESIDKIDISDTLVKPSIEITGKGDFSKKIFVEDISNDATLTDINCLIGTPFDFQHNDDLSFEKSTLTFTIDKSVLESNQIDDLAIAWYDEENNCLQLLDTVRDAEKNTITAEVEHYSRYMVVSVSKYFYDIDWKNASSTITNGKADVVFVVDTTGSMGYAIQNVKNNINQFTNELKANNVDIRLGLVEYKDIYADGYGSTKSYDWYYDTDSFANKVNYLGAFGGGDEPESVVDALNCAQNMEFRVGVNKYIILLTDASYKNGTVSDANVTMADEISKLISNDISTSVITRTSNYSTYNDLVIKTDGVTGDISNNFVSELRTLISKMGENAKNGCWIRLSNGSVVRLDADPTLGDVSVDTDSDGIPDVNELKSSYYINSYNPITKQIEKVETWSFYSNPVKLDTDGDGLMDIEDLRPCAFDTRITNSTDSVIEFNTGRTWKNITCTSYDYLDNLNVIIDGIADNPIPIDEFKIIIANVRENQAQDFSYNELACIGLLNNEGAKLYLDNKSSATRERVFEMITGRKSLYYQSTSDSYENWVEVPESTKGGFFEGKVISEYDLNFSNKAYYIYDVYDVLARIEAAGALIISAVIFAEAATYIIANVQEIRWTCSTFGISNGLQMYATFGKNGILSFIEYDMADGDTSIDDASINLAKILQVDLSDGESELSIQDKTLNKLANNIAQKATHGNYNTVVLGRYNIDGINYVDIAINNKSTYYSVNTKIWNILKDKYGENFMWLVNQRFMEQQALKGVTFNFSHDIYKYYSGDYAKELDFLRLNYKDLMGTLIK